MTPGEHFFGDRAAGFQVRDTVLVLLPGPHLMTLMLLRADLDGTVAETVRKHGAGGLWIDGCRIGSELRQNVQKVPAENLNTLARPGGGDASNARGLGAYGVGARQASGPARMVSGRWPTNLILVHGPGCRQVGARQVRGSHDTTGVWGPGCSGATYGTFKGLQSKQTGYTSPDGTEEVPDWSCQPDCPIRLLDEQAGEHRTTWIAPEHQNNRVGEILGALQHPGSQGYNDDGAVSRFFPQFPDLDAALAWLGRLIGRTGDPRRVRP